MPLPSALVSRLRQRGIIQNEPQTKHNQPNQPQSTPFPFCPNTYNIYHDCSVYCQTRWKGFATPEPRYVKNMKVVLAVYPLPPKWEQAFDRGVGRYYYWNTDNDMVSWLPPGHPNAKTSESAEKKRQRRRRCLQDLSLRNTSCSSEGRKCFDKQSDLDHSAYSDGLQGSSTYGVQQNHNNNNNTASGKLYHPSPGDILAAINRKTRFSWNSY